MSLTSFLNGARDLINGVLRRIQEGVNDESIEYSHTRLNSLLLNITRISTRFPECAILWTDVNEAINIVNDLKRAYSHTSELRPTTRQNGRKGRPHYEISREQLELLTELNFTNKSIAEILHVSESVVKRRLKLFEINRSQKYSMIPDDELDDHVQHLTNGNPSIGQRIVQGLLKAEGYNIQRSRVSESLIRVDAAAVAMRWSTTILRRTYRVPGTNSLWHIDGNHKLIRWGFVIHGGIDGFSRLVVFMTISTNNRSATVLKSFLDATEKYGVPSRVRCDHGMENVEVATFMVAYRGINRGSCLTGKSVHNQRIERFWRDVFAGCTNVYYALFYHLEAEHLLNPDNSVEVWCLHFIFEKRIQRDLNKFVMGWNEHRLSSERGKSPMQLYTAGILQNRGRRLTAIDELFYEPNGDIDIDTEQDTDWNVPIPDQNSAQQLIDTECPLTANEIDELKEQIDPLSHSADGFGIDLYIRTLAFCQRVRN